MVVGIVIGVIGHDRIRQWLRIDEPEPYYTSAFSDKDLCKDRIVGLTCLGIFGPIET
jgi:hypothetical protein